MNMVVAPQILRLLREAPPGTFDNIMLAHGWNLLCQASYTSIEFPKCTVKSRNRAQPAVCRTPVSYIAYSNVQSSYHCVVPHQDGMEVVQECCARGIEIHNAGVYCSGLLVGGDTYFYSKAAPEPMCRPGANSTTRPPRFVWVVLALARVCLA